MNQMSHSNQGQLIGLVDCNNFFVSCERLFRPDLATKPVAVLSSNDGCIIARSQEIKDIGVPMGTPYFKVKDSLKDNDVTLFSGNITLYRDLSRRVSDVIRTYFSCVEQYSIDECFFTIAADENVKDNIAAMRAAIWQQTGVPVSIGVARTKTLSKCAVSAAKRDTGIFVETEDWWHSDVRSLGVGEVWGVGRGMLERYCAAGISTVGELLQADSTLIRSCGGVGAVRLQAELRGSVAYPVTPVRALQKSLMNSRSFSRTTNNLSIIQDAASYHARHIAEELRAMQAVAGAVRVSLHTSRHGDFVLRGGSREIALANPTNDTFALVSMVQTQLLALHEPGVPYQKVLVAVSGITLAGVATSSFFAKLADTNETLLSALDAINAKADRELVVIGSRLRTRQWQPKSASRSPAYTTRWSDLPTVKAA
jgi:DNA polymerase V